MTSLGRHHVRSSSALLMRILERPELVSAVRELPAPVLGTLGAKLLVFARTDRPRNPCVLRRCSRTR
jgi:hypothetical protein